MCNDVEDRSVAKKLSVIGILFLSGNIFFFFNDLRLSQSTPNHLVVLDLPIAMSIDMQFLCYLICQYVNFNTEKIVNVKTASLFDNKISIRALLNVFFLYFVY